MITSANGRQFVCRLRPVFERSDVVELLRFLSEHYSPSELTDLLSCEDHEVVNTSLVCLSFSGTMADSPTIARLLHHHDSSTVGFAEHALWSIWFRTADPLSNAALYRAVQIISENAYCAAIEHLTLLIQQKQDFAEAYNQRSIAHFLAGDYETAIADCEQTLRLNPHHFGALATLGHSHAAMGNVSAAQNAYRAVLGLHPRLDGIKQSLESIAELTHQRAMGDSTPSVTSY